jgi:hypothetical protein
MAVFVFGTETQTLGRMGDLQCSVCNSKRPFNAAARYAYFEVAVFGVAGFAQYSIMCAACKTSWPLDRKQAKAFKKEGLLPQPDVPPLRRFGLLAMALVIGALISLNKFGPLITAGSILAAVTVFALPGVIKGVRSKGIKGYTKEAVAADRPVSLFESVGGLPAERVTERDLYRKCPACGLNNAATDSQCERCGAALAAPRGTGVRTGA